MQIIEKAIAELKEYQNNPRNNDEAVEAVAESIKQFGFKVPIVIDNKNVIVCGHTRLKAAERLGLSSVPCIVADDLTDEQIKAYRLADNKTAELAEWDFDALEKELAELTAFDVDMSAFGFDDLEEYEHISELLEDESAMSLLNDNEKTTFNITFVFPIEKEEMIKNYIKDIGKDNLTDEIIMHIEKGAG